MFVGIKITMSQVLYIDLARTCQLFLLSKIASQSVNSSLLKGHKKCEIDSWSRKLAWPGSKLLFGLDIHIKRYYGKIAPSG